MPDYEVFTLNYDLLVGYDKNLGYTEGFATSWTTSEDGKTTTFKVRPGMKWSDGEPATADDAEYTYQLVLDALAEETTLGSGYLDGYVSSAGVTKAEATDPETLVVTTETPTPLLLAAYVPILPKHIREKYSLEQIANAEADGFFANDPPVVGTGPYQAVEYQPGSFMRFARNPNYWGKQGAADEVIITHFENNDTMTQALRNGELDYARGMNADAFDALAGQPASCRSRGSRTGTRTSPSTAIRRRSRAAARRPGPWRTPRSATRSPGASTCRRSSTGSSPVTARPAQVSRRPSSRSGTSRPRPTSSAPSTSPRPTRS